MTADDLTLEQRDTESRRDFAARQPTVSDEECGAWCICGHGIAHHMASVLGLIPQQCEWRGCGCPRFAAAHPDPATDHE